MEWVETTAKTVEEAKELALDQLGVDEADAEFEVLEEPRPGLFGRVRGEARVRARVKPTRPRPKVERRKRRDAKPDAPARQKVDHAVNDSPAPDTPLPDRRPAERPSADDVASEAQRFMDGLLHALGVEGSTTIEREGDELEARVEGGNLGVLIGPRGTTLLAVQDLARVASQRRIGDHDTRLRVDINGYREKRRQALARFALQQADEVTASGTARVLEPMPSADRKVIHDALVGRTDVMTRSEGEDPARRVIIAPAGSGSPD